MVTIDELAKRVEALEKDNADLKAKMTSLTKTTQETSLLKTIQPRNRILGTADTPPAQIPPITETAIADVLGGFINNFNAKADGGGSPVSYMMSEVEVDLKTVVVTRPDGTLVLEPADVDTPPQAVTPLKLSVKAVPRATAVAAKK
jgi:hypothetical protein